MVRRKRTTEDRLALRMSRLAGIALGPDEYDDSFDDFDDLEAGGRRDEEGGDNIDLPPLGDKAGDVSMEQVLCDLLRALGVNCEPAGNHQQFKRNLYLSAMQKVHELTGQGRNEPKPGSIGKEKPSSNPLLPGNDPGGLREEAHPAQFSLQERVAHIEANVGDHRLKGAMLSMAIDNDAMQRRQAEGSRDAARQREAKLGEARALRQRRIDRILAMNPSRWVWNEVDRICNGFGDAAFSMDARGEVQDRCETALAALEVRVKDQLAKDRQPR